MKIISLLVLLLLPLYKVDAFYCSYSTLARLKGLASNINTTYEFTEKDNNVTFTITLTNLHKDLYIVDTSNNKTHTYTKSELKLSGYRSGQVIKYDIYSNIDNCNDVLYSITIKLPSYNPYYKDKVCEGMVDYSLCQRWTNHYLSYEEFVKQVEKQKQIQETPVIIPDVDDDYSIWNLISQYLATYYYIPLIMIVIGCGIGIYVLNKKSNMYR